MTTGIVIGFGAGAALGIALLIWALNERAKRHSAEQTNLKLANKINVLMSAKANANRAAMEAQSRCTDLSAQLTTVRRELDFFRDRLRSCKDPEAIAKWLKDELS